MRAFAKYALLRSTNANAAPGGPTPHDGNVLLSGDEQSGADQVLLSGDEQSGVDVLVLSGNE